MKNKFRILMAVIACVCCMTLLAGCMGNSAAEEQKTQNRKYMSSVNTIMADMEDSMDEFSTALKGGEVLSLSSELDKVSDCVDRLKALKAPEAMKTVNEDYVTGATELQQALELYVELYEDVKAPASGSFNFDKYDKRLAEIQKHYDAGIAALEKADKEVSEA